MVMAIAGKAQAMIGAANTSSDSIETPTLVANLTTNSEGTLQVNQTQPIHEGCVVTVDHAQIIHSAHFGDKFNDRTIVLRATLPILLWR